MEALQIRDELESRRELKKEWPCSLLTSIGNTPLIQIQQITKGLRGVQVFAKAESMDRGLIVTIFPEGEARYPEYCLDCERQKKRLSVEHSKLRPSPP